MSKFTKFSNVVWRINGIIILFVFIFFIAGFTVQLFKEMNEKPIGGALTPTELASMVERDIKEKVAYGEAIVLEGSPYIIIPLCKVRGERSFIKEYNEGIINYLFLHESEKELKKLFPSEVRIFSSNLQNYGDQNHENSGKTPLIYHVVTKDTNGDKLLNSYDFSSLYISDCNGDNLKAITPEERKIDYFENDLQDAKIVIGVRDKEDNEEIIIYDYKTGKSINYEFANQQDSEE